MQSVILAAGLVHAAHATTIELQLEPHHSQGIENSYAFTINATCTIKVKNNNNKIRFDITKNSGKINGKTLTNGQSTSITVDNQDQIEVHAEPDTKVTVYNLGDNTVHASCSA
jgi:hypothetical protein